MAPIPICMCGKQPRLAVLFAKNMGPEYDVVYHFQSASAFNSEFPLLITGKRIESPRSDIGSNVPIYHSQDDNDTQPEPRIPLAIFLGADFTEPEILELSSSYPDLPWLASAPERRWESKRIADANPEGPGPLALVAGRAKECFKANGLVEVSADGALKWKGGRGLWRY